MICVLINSNKCIGCRLCTREMPRFFIPITKNLKVNKLRQKNKSVKKISQDLSLKQLKKITGIIENCPAQAITIIK